MDNNWSINARIDNDTFARTGSGSERFQSLLKGSSSTGSFQYSTETSQKDGHTAVSAHVSTSSTAQQQGSSRFEEAITGDLFDGNITSLADLLSARETQVYAPSVSAQLDTTSATGAGVGGAGSPVPKSANTDVNSVQPAQINSTERSDSMSEQIASEAATGDLAASDGNQAALEARFQALYIAMMEKQVSFKEAVEPFKIDNQNAGKG